MRPLKSNNHTTLNIQNCRNRDTAYKRDIYFFISVHILHRKPHIKIISVSYTVSFSFLIYVLIKNINIFAP